MTHLLATLSDREARSVGFRSLTGNVDTTTPTGRLVFHNFRGLGQFERDLIRERTNAGLNAAARERKGGRLVAATPEKVARTQQSIESGLTVREAAARAKESKSALHGALRLRQRTQRGVGSNIPPNCWRGRHIFPAVLTSRFPRGSDTRCE